jgi:tetratricopeptide (TPR) repeat protein
MLGYIFLKQRNFAAAEQELKRAAKLNPADTGTRLSLAEVYVDTDRLLEAEKTLRELVASSTEGSPGNILIRAHYMLGRLLQEGGKLEEGAAEINKAEQLRKQLRLSAAEVLTARVSKPATAVSKGIDGPSSGASAQQKPQAQAFIAHLSPAIAEAYYNLAAIASQHRDSLTAAQYLSKAKAWDPTIATGGQ